MSEPAFPPNVSAALDRLTVPPLPQGFGDRLIARIEAGDLPHIATDVAQHLPSPRRRFGGSGWRRSGGIVAIAATFSLATATAAASGFFGEPIYVPVVSDALAKADLVELPKREQIAPKPAAQATNMSAENGDTKIQPTPQGREAVRSLYQRLRDDPEFRTLPRHERMAIARQEIRTLVQNGDVTISELRHAMAEHRLRTDPATRQTIRREIVRRKLQSEAAPVATTPADVPEGRLQPGVEARREAFRELAPEQQGRILELRQQLRNASSAERRAIRQELRAMLQSHTDAPVEEKIEPASEGNQTVVR